MKTVQADDAQLRYEHALHPGAPALLMLHSLGASLEMWDDQQIALGERYEMIRFDLRGHGRSETGSLQEATIDRLARDALAVLDACGIARAHLCGLSLGGMIAMHIAAHWPDRVLKAALCSTSAHMPPRENWDARIKTVTDEGLAPLVEGILNRWFTEGFRAAEPDRVERVRAMLLGSNPDGYAACSAAIRDMDQRESIKTITAKTLVISGAHDPGIPPAQAESLASSIPGAKLTVLEASHLLNIERAEEFNATLLEFLAA